MKALRFFAIMYFCVLAGAFVQALGIARHGASEPTAIVVGGVVMCCLLALLRPTL